MKNIQLYQTISYCLFILHTLSIISHSNADVSSSRNLSDNRQIAAATPKTFIVSGVKNEAGDPAWKNLLIAQGVVNLISEELFKTGRFIPLENTPEILTQIEQLSEYIWGSSDDIKISQANEKALSLGSDIVVYAVLKKIKKSRTRKFAGPFSASEVVVSVEIELILNEQGKILSADGRGEGITKSKSVIFRVRQDKIYFDETSVGQAVSKAVQEAVKNLISKQQVGHVKK